MRVRSRYGAVNDCIVMLRYSLVKFREAVVRYRYVPYHVVKSRCICRGKVV